LVLKKKRDTDENNVNYIQHKLSTVQLSIKLKYSINSNHIHFIAVLAKRILTRDYPKMTFYYSNSTVNLIIIFWI